MKEPSRFLRFEIMLINNNELFWCCPNYDQQLTDVAIKNLVTAKNPLGQTVNVTIESSTLSIGYKSTWDISNDFSN